MSTSIRRRATPPFSPPTASSSPQGYGLSEHKEIAEIALLLLDLVKGAEAKAEELARKREAGRG